MEIAFVFYNSYCKHKQDMLEYLFYLQPELDIHSNRPECIQSDSLEANILHFSSG